MARHARWHGEDQIVEVDTPTQGQRLGVRNGAPVRFEVQRVDARGVVTVRGEDLARWHTVRVAGQALARDQGVVLLASVGEAQLTPDGDGVDASPVGADVQPVDAVQVLDAHPSPTKGLVQRSEHHVAHAGRHLPEDGPPVVEERPTGQVHPEPGAEPRT